MVQRRTNQGQTIDLEGIALANEKTIAVGNMRVNARGDSIDDEGNIVKTKTEKAQAYYSSNPKAVVKTVSIKDAIDSTQVKTMETAPIQQKASKPKASKPKASKPKASEPKEKVMKEVELPNGDIELVEADKE